MEKNIYLTRTEQSLFETIRETDVISLDEIIGLFPRIKAGMRNKVLSSLSKKGYLYRIRNGLYLVNKSPSKQPQIEDVYKLAQRLFSGYIAFSSALRLYDLIEYEPFTVFVATRIKGGTYTIGNYEIRGVSMGRRAKDAVLHKGRYVSNLEKTFFDCFYKPQYAGGYEGVTKALWEAKSIDWNAFGSYFDDLASPSLCQRSGYVLELMKKRLEMDIPDRLIKHLGERVGKMTRLLPSSPAKGSYSAKWHLMNNQGEESIMGWASGY